MSLDLPPTVAAYVAANARLDVEAMLQTFAADAVFRDNAAVFQGRSEIRGLLEKEVVPVKAIFTPDSLRREGGDLVVEGPAHGDFPGSPIRFTYRFTLEGDAIKTLQVTA